MKKIFVQPELMVVNINKNDIIATSTRSVSVYGTDYNEGTMTDLAPDRFRDWD